MDMKASQRDGKRERKRERTSDRLKPRPSSKEPCDWLSDGLTEQVSGEVDRQDNADREDADDHQQTDDVALEGQVVHGVLATLLPDLLVPAGGRGKRRGLGTAVREEL